MEQEEQRLKKELVLLFEQIKFGKIKIKIFKEYKLSEAKKAHEDLEGRKILGPAVLIPN